MTATQRTSSVSIQNSGGARFNTLRGWGKWWETKQNIHTIESINRRKLRTQVTGAVYLHADVEEKGLRGQSRLVT